MLSKILEALTKGEIFFLQQIAEITGQTLREVENGLALLEYRGYVKRQSAENGCSRGCGWGKSAQKNCAGCALNAPKGVIWELTERGWDALSTSQK